MAIQMTRKEYEAKYGAKPVATSTSASSSSPIKMTRAEYNAKYGEQTTNPNGAFFRASPTDGPLDAGLKSAGNLPSSLFNFGKGIYEAAKNPIETVKGIASIPLGAGALVARKLTGDTTTPELGVESKVKAFTQVLNDRYGASFGDKKFNFDEFLQTLQKTATEDPVGFGTDILGVLEGGASLAGKTSQLNRAIGTVGRTASKPVTSVAGGIANKASEAAKFGVSQATGLNPETITELIKNPGAFKNVNPQLRIETATKVGEALDSRLADLSDLGSGYNVIRETPGTVVIPKGTVEKVFNKYGIKVGEDGKIITGPESRPLSTGDKAGLEEFIKDYGSQEVLSQNGFLNTREKLSKLSKFDSTRTDISQAIARELRDEYNKAGRPQVKGLSELDSEFGPERELLGQLKRDIFDAKGELKDGAISKIANITGKGKEKFIERVKQVVPDIEERVNLIKAVEDIERANGIKVGTYTRGGAIIGGAVTGNLPLIIGAIIAQPAIAIPLLKGAGYVGQKAAPILEAVKQIANDVNNFRLPESFKNSEGQMKMGASIESVTPESVAKRVDGEDLKLIRNLVEKGDLDSYLKAQPILDGAGVVGMDLKTLKRFLGEVLDLNTRKLQVKSIPSRFMKGERGLFTGSKSVSSPASYEK